MNNVQLEALFEFILIIIAIILTCGMAYLVAWIFDESIPAYVWYLCVVIGGINARLVILKKYVGKK